MKRKLGPKGRVVIPKPIRAKLRLKEGAMLTFEVSGDTILVRPERSSEEVVRRFLSVKGRKFRKPVDWKSVLDEEHKTPAKSLFRSKDSLFGADPWLNTKGLRDEREPHEGL